MRRRERRAVRRLVRTALLIALGLPLLVTSCADEGGPLAVQSAGTSCTEDAECSFYLTCREGVCRFRCASDADCSLLGRDRDGLPYYTCQAQACLARDTSEADPPLGSSDEPAFDAGPTCNPAGTVVRADVPRAGASSLRAMAVDATHVYVESSGSSAQTPGIYAASLGGTGTFQRILDLTASGAPSSGLTWSGTSLYFVDGKKLKRLALPASKPPAVSDVFTSSGSAPSILASTSYRVFFTAPGGLFRLSSTTNTVDAQPLEAREVPHAATSATHVYWHGLSWSTDAGADAGSSPALFKAPIGDGPGVPLEAAVVTDTGPYVAHRDSLFWTDGGGSLVELDTTRFAPPRVIHPSPLNGANGWLLAQGGYVYYTAAGSTESCTKLVRLSLETREEEPLFDIDIELDPPAFGRPFARMLEREGMLYWLDGQGRLLRASDKTK